MDYPPVVELEWEHQYRVIASVYPPINFFEGLVDPELMEELHHIESLTNDRLRDEVGDIALVSEEDRVSGPGSSPVMAAFTHVSKASPSRFSDGSFGVYYAAKTMSTAIEESRFHRANFLADTKEEPGEVDMRVYIGEVIRPMHNIQDDKYEYLHDPDDWSAGQAFGQTMRSIDSWGMVYNSVRDPGGECIAALKPTSISIPRQGPHLSYVWDGKTIANIYEKTLIK